MSNVTHRQASDLPQKLGVEHLLPGQSVFNWREGLAGRNTPVDRSAKPKNATRVNQFSSIGRSLPQADYDKTARIRGRTNESRSQQ